MGDVELDYVVPAADLAAYVTVFYRFAMQLAAFDEIERADRAQFRFRLTPHEGHYRFADGVEVTPPPCHLVAATHGIKRSRVAGPAVVFGFGLTPAGWAAIVGRRGRSVRVIDARELIGATVDEVGDALRGCADATAMVTAVEPLLRQLVAGGDLDTLHFVRAVETWLAGAASPALDVLVAETRLSRRQVERRCNALYGAPPKLLARKYRALRAAVALASGAASVDALLADGFYDQSHLIRELKQFTGLTPRQLRDSPGLLARLTIDRRRALSGQVGPLISDT